ncbi:MAG: CpaF family protein [Sneathiella sp.]|nr:CpaF family protein [Sneathiella sp.]
MFGKKEKSLLTEPREITGGTAGSSPINLMTSGGDRVSARNDTVTKSNFARDAIQEALLARIDPTVAARTNSDQLLAQINKAVGDIASEQRLQLNQKEQEAIALEMLDDMLGLGPIEPLMKDDTIADIMVNGPNSVFVERNGIIEETDITFRDDLHVLRIAQRIASRVGRRIDESSPMVDARLADGSRVNVVGPPLALKGTCISIRKFPKDSLLLDDFARSGSLSKGMARLLEICARIRLNIIIAGGTGSGKTTMMNAMSAMIDRRERIVTIEDAAELRLQQPHVISLETRPQNIEGAGEVTQRDLLRNALRMRPDRIIIGEVRGAEAFDMLQAMNTGHSGSMSTIHSNSARDALIRLENMMLMGTMQMPILALRRQIVSAVDLIIYLERMRDGRRRVTSITEVVGLEGDVIVSQDLFTYDYKEEMADGTLAGEFLASGIRPKFYKQAQYYGLTDALQEAFA